MEVLAGVALTGSALFGYNKSNFKYDREQRLKKEFREQRMRLAQADLWREDVRDMLKLTQRKLEMYMLVSVLMLSFAVSLWCEGHLPEGVTPQWLMLGYQIAIGGAFTFLLLAVWLATYATVAAQSYATRMLTQLVRLPVPTWNEIEASRTYASEYEQIQAKQMFRVPFFTGHQERHVDKAPSAPAASVAVSGPPAPPSRAGFGGAAARADDSAVDPWGLERKGACPELESGGGTGADVARLRHVKLMRQASQHWQTYDAFARVSMSVGVNQLMLAISYFIVGFVLIELEATWAALAGVMVLIVMAEVIILLDLTIPKRHQRMLTVIQLGPFVMLVAAYQGSQGTESGEHTAELLASVAFLLHAGFLAMIALFCAVKEHSNGAMLPFAFRGVLYLDAFAWVPKDSLELDEDESGKVTADAQRQIDRDNIAELLDLEEYGHAAPVAAPVAVAPAAIKQTSDERQTLRKQASYYAMDYLDPEVNKGGQEGDGERESSRILFAKASCQHSLVRDASGKHRPSCPRDFKDPGAAQDMRREDGAPRMWDHVSADSVPEKGFYDAISWLPTSTQQKLPENNFKATQGKAEQRVGGRAELDVLGKDIFEPITGHDKEKPGILPWKIFSYAIYILCLVWFFAGVSTVLGVMPAAHVAWASQGSIQGVKQPKSVQTTVHHLMTQVKSFSSFLSVHAEHSSVGPPHHGVARMNVSWPFPGTTPKTLSCDASGRHFAVSDGLSSFFAELDETQNATSITDSLKFKHAPSCQGTRGQTLQDLAIFCPAAGACEALVLHNRGRKVSACPLLPGTGAGSHEASRNITQKWLTPEASGRGHHTETAPEKVSWVSLDPKCDSVDAAAALRDGCADIATSLGRVARLTKDHGVVPFEGPEPIAGFGQPDSVRSFGLGVGVLQDRRLEVLDDAGSLLDTFTLDLPLRSSMTASGFCVGGGHIHVLGSGPGPVTIWRSELPEHIIHGKK